MSVLPPAFDRNWFLYSVRVYPQDTDYAGVVWHGNYLGWLEAARVEYLRAVGVDFAELVTAGLDLPVVNLSLRYHRPVRLGALVTVAVRLLKPERLRLHFENEIRVEDALYVTATITLAPVDLKKGKVTRTLPPSVEKAIALMFREVR